MKTVIQWNKDQIIFPQTDLDNLKSRAQAAPDHKARYNLHPNLDCELQQMIICIDEETPTQIHKHSDKDEIFHVIEGRGLLIIYYDDLSEKGRFELDLAQNFVARIEKETWHSLTALGEQLIIHEITMGPFDREQTVFKDLDENK